MIHLLTIGALLRPIRLYSTNWRNSDDILVKQVIYDPILKEFRPSEHNDKFKDLYMTRNLKTTRSYIILVIEHFKLHTLACQKEITDVAYLEYVHKHVLAGVALDIEHIVYLCEFG